MLWRSMMSESKSKVLEGVFAVKKPPSLSSAQVLRDLQHAFASSRTFQPLLRATQEAERRNSYNRSKRRRIDNNSKFKMGHGGTLDPLATGVLIVGIGRGTKSLQDFLDCTKTYETVVLFGKSTDTYDIAGKVVTTAKTTHVTESMVKEKLSNFRGAIKQVPPVYSALKIDGLKAYDYARSGKSLPRDLPTRDMKVEECELVEWYGPGGHNFRWPKTHVQGEERAIFEQLIRGDEGVTREADSTSPNVTSVADGPTNISNDESVGVEPVSDATTIVRPQSPREQKAAKHTHEVSDLCEEAANAPAARIRLTVSSGFYVRSFAHDLGIMCGSYATMAELIRTRQGDFTLSNPPPDNQVPTINHDDLNDENIWGPTISSVLEKWLENHPSNENAELQLQSASASSGSRNPGRGGYKFRENSRGKAEDRRQSSNKRRNSSSPEL